jgi:hypothetical protein
MKKSYPIFFLLLIFLILPVWPALSSSETVKFIKGISIHNKEVSNLTKEEAYIKLKPSIEEILKQDVILISPSGENILIIFHFKIHGSIQVYRQSNHSPGNTTIYIFYILSKYPLKYSQNIYCNWFSTNSLTKSKASWVFSGSLPPA